MTSTSRLSAALTVYAIIGCVLVQSAPLWAQDLSQDLAEAVKLFEEHSYTQAIPKLEALTKANESLEPAWYYLGVCKLRTGDYEGALAALRKAVELRPGRPGISFHMGELYELQGAYDQAIGAYEDELRKREGSGLGEVFNALGRAYYYSGRYRDAIEVLKQAVDANENFVEAIYTAGLCQYQLKEYERALKEFDKASEILKEWDRLVGRVEELTKKEERRTLSPKEQRDKQHAKEDLAEKYSRASEFAIDLGLRPALNIATGDAADANKEWARARTAYRHALVLNEGGNPADPLPHAKIGRTLLHEAQQAFSERGLLFQSVRIVDQGIAKAEEALSYNDAYAPAYECLGEIYSFQAATYISDPDRNITSHDWDEAVAQFDLALDKDPNYVQALLYRARAFVALGEGDKATQDLQTAIDLDPNNAELYASLSSAQRINEDYDEAINSAQTALLLDPDNVDAHNAAGLAYYYLGEFGLASEHFTKAIHADPNQHQSYTNLGNTFFQLGSWHRARTQYEKALKLIPTPSLANTAYQRSYLYYLVARTYHYTGMYKEEVEALNQALALDPAYLDAMLQLAQAYVELPQYRAAEEVLRTALDISPGPEVDAGIYVSLGALFEREGKPHEALTAYGQALAAQSNNPEAKEAIERLQAG